MDIDRLMMLNPHLKDVFERIKTIYYEDKGKKYFAGDKVCGDFDQDDDSVFGVVFYGLFKAPCHKNPNKVSEYYGFYVKTNKPDYNYPLDQLKNLCRYIY